MWKIFSFLKMFREDLLIMMVALKDSRTPAALGRRRAPERCGHGAVRKARARCAGGSAGEVRFASKHWVWYYIWGRKCLEQVGKTYCTHSAQSQGGLV